MSQNDDPANMEVVDLINCVRQMTPEKQQELIAFARMVRVREYLRRQRPEFAADFRRLLGECLELLERPE